jgi:biopolymer transport protein ExbD
MPELESRLSAAHARDKDMPVMIKGDPQAYYSLVVDIIDMAGRLNISNVGLVTSRIGT